jgi:Tfp pilus assembly protein PilF
MNKIVLYLLLAVIAIGCSPDSATIKEINMNFITYPFYDPDPVPRPERNYYPYFRFDGYSHDSVSADWKVIVMENPYVKVHIFPEIGGKIWGAIEKSTGNEFIYYNNVVKFRNIAMRGPWTSGGIELNFGVIGHTPAVSTPVDYTTRKNDDGSVSCFVGVLDLLTRTRWETEINLHPDNAYFTTNTRWINSTPFLQPYYQWSNAAYQAEGDLELIFPGAHRIGHGGEAYSWPIDDEGRDLSFYRNNAFGGNKSNHIVGGPTDFFAAYWHDLDFGAGHYSMFGDKLGKKVWLWSQARSGGIWEDLLTDTDGQYVELQSGRLFNQASTSSTRTPFKHYGFSPHATDEFREYWYPVMDIGGVVQANYLGALNLVKGGNSQKVLMSPLQPIKDEMKIYFGDELKYTFNLNLKPLEVWEADISLNTSSEPLEIVVGDKALVYSEQDGIIIPGRPVESPKDFDWNSVFGLYTDGINWVYQNRFDRAYSSFRACLDKDPSYTPALNQIAELYVRKADFEKALSHVKRSLAIDTYDSKANFLFGYINRHLNNFSDSQDGFAVASITPGYRTASYIELAKLFTLRNELLTAEKYGKRVLDSDASNQEALLLMAIIARKNGLDKDASGYLDRLESISPLNHFARFERLLLNDNRRSVENFTSMIKNELPYQTYIEMALWYEYLGYTNEAIRLLEMAPGSALGYLKLSYMYDRLNDPESSKTYFNHAAGHSPDFVLPFRTEFVPVLEWAVKRTDDWKPKYYLGLLHWRLGNKIAAKDMFASCQEVPDSPNFYLARKDLFAGDPVYDPMPGLLKARELGKSDWRPSLALIDHHLEKNNTTEALNIAREASRTFPGSDALKFAYAKCLLANGYYSESLNELENTVILPHEGASYGRVTYRQAAVMESLEYLKKNNPDLALKSIDKARLWPENLGVGRPYEVDERIEDFVEAKILMHSGDKEGARSLYQDVINNTRERRGRATSTDFLYLAALREMGMRQQSENFLAQWQRNAPNDPVLRWARAVMNNDLSSAQRIEREIQTEAGGTPWDPRFADSDFELIKAISYQMNFQAVNTSR